MRNKIICFYLLFILFNFSLAAEKANNNYPIKKQALINEGKILLKLDAANLVEGFKDRVVTFVIKPSHIDQSTEIILKKVTSKINQKGIAQAILPINDLLPTKYRFQISVADRDKTVFEHEEFFEVVPNQHSSGSKTKVVAIFKAEWKKNISVKKKNKSKKILNISFDEKANSLIDKLGISTQVVNGGLKNSKALKITGTKAQAQYSMQTKLIPASRGESIKLSFDYKTSKSLNKDNFKLMYYVVGKNNKVLKVEYIGIDNSKGKWAKFNRFFEVVDGAECIKFVFRFIRVPVADWAYVDNITAYKKIMSNANGPINKFISTTPLIGQNSIYVNVNSNNSKLDNNTIKAWINVKPNQDNFVINNPLSLKDGKGSLSIKIKKYVPGKYKISLKLQDKNKKLFNTSTSFTLPPKPAFLNSLIGIEALDDDCVLPPFTPIKITPNNTVNILNRKYRIGSMCLPSEVITNKASLLDGNITLSCYSGDKDLFSEMRAKKALTLKKSAKGVVEFTENGNDKNFKVSIKTSIEYDGLIIYTIDITPKNPLQVDRLRLNIPIKRKYAKYLWVGGEPTTRTTKGLRINDRSFYKGIANKGVVWQSPFKRMVWVGNDDQGLEWWSDTEKNWFPQEYSKRMNAQQIINNGDTVSIQINLISSKTTLKKKTKFSFGFMATPMRPKPKGWRGWKFMIKNYWTYKKGAELANLYCYWAQPPWSLRAHSPEIGDMIAYKKNMKEDHNNRRDTLPYFSPFIFGYGTYKKDGTWDVRSPLYEYFKDEWEKRPYATLTTPRKDGIHKELITCTNSSWTDYFLYHWKKHVECGADGISIFDGGPNPCKNQLHGCGYYDDKGNLKETVSVMSMRNMVKRLFYVTLQGRKKRGYKTRLEGLGIDHTHFANGQVSKTLFDGGLKGEDLNSGYWISDEKYKKLLFKDKYYYANILTLEKFRIGWGHQWGFVPIFFPQLIKSPGISKEWATSPEGTKDFMVYVLLHDILALPHWCHVETIFDTWKVKDKFGIETEDVEFFPYFKNKKWVSSSNKDIKVSFYKKPGKILLIAANVSKKKQSTQIKLLLKGEKFKKVIDGLTDQRIVFDNQKFNITLPPRDYKMIIIDVEKR